MTRHIEVGFPEVDEELHAKLSDLFEPSKENFFLILYV